MTKLRKMFESKPKNRESEGAAFLAIGLGDIAKGRKEKNR